MTDSNPLLASHWRKQAVLNCLDAGDTIRLVCFLRERHTERFFEPIHRLTSASGNEQGFGFAIMALCCLLVETIQCYREGLPSSNETELERLRNYDNVPPKYQITEDDLKIKGKEIFRRFFTDYQSYFPCANGIDFYNHIRNGLLHQAQTKGGWTINIERSKLWDVEQQSVDRDLFSYQLENCFGKYLSDLSVKPFEQPEWSRAAKKVWWLCELS